MARIPISITDGQSRRELGAAATFHVALDLDLSHVANIVVSTHSAAPGCVVSAALGDRRGSGCAGALRLGSSELVSQETPYDLASLTKPLVALTTTRLVKRGALSLEERLSALLPWAEDTDSGSTTLERLLSHRAGLPAHLKLYQPLIDGREVDRAAAARLAAERRPECKGSPPPEGFAPVYSDMGYLLVGLALEARTGQELAELVDHEVLAPLGLSGRIGSARQLDRPGRDFRARVAPTEVVDFRGGLVNGVVHDENAWVMSGLGVSGHAGLFGDANAVRAIGCELLRVMRGESAWLEPDELAPLLRARPGGSLRAGFDGRTLDNPSSGTRLGPATFGHLGFTGTSIWIDPDRSFVGVLLSNRVHPTRDHIAIRAARPQAYDAMFDALTHPR